MKLRRRTFLLKIMAIALGIRVPDVSANKTETSLPTTANSTEISFTFEVPEAHKDIVLKELEPGKSKITAAKGKAVLVWVIAGVILLPYLVQSILKLQSQILHGGVIVDTRNGKVDVKVSKLLPPGMILVIKDDGEVEFERNEIESPNALFEIILKALPGGK